MRNDIERVSAAVGPAAASSGGTRIRASCGAVGFVMAGLFAVSVSRAHAPPGGLPASTPSSRSSPWPTRRG